MPLTPKQRERLAEIADYRPRGMQPPDCLFKDDLTGKSLLKRGLVDVSFRRMKTAAMKEPGDVCICWATEAGRKEIGR
jgi:hypothetical protein